jgi:hypothetical protein
MPAVSPDIVISWLWINGDLSWKLWPQQKTIYNTIRNFPRSVQTVVVLCARQFGKSVLGCILALEDCLANDNIVVLIIGPTIKQTRAIVNPRIKLLMRDCPDGLIHHMVSTDTFHFRNGSELKLGGFDTSSSSERGKTIYKVYIEEIVDSDGDDYLDFIRGDLAPALTHSKHAQIVFLTTLPKIPDHPFSTDTVPEAMLQGAFFKYTIDDNKQIDQEQYNSCVKLCGGKDSTMFKREYLCEQVRDESIILTPEFDEARHVKEIVLPTHCNFWISGDTGGIRDKSVFLLWGFDFERNKKMVLDEQAFAVDTGSNIMAAKVKLWEQNYKITGGRWVDAPGQLQIDFMQQHGFPCTLPRKDELPATVNQVRVALARGEVEISPTCKLLIATLRSGTFNDTRTDLARSSKLGHMDAFMSFAYGLRHAHIGNPFPAFGGADPHTHYIARDKTAHNNSSAEALRRAILR